MKIKKLLEKLKKFDPELEINIIANVPVLCDCCRSGFICYCSNYEEKDFYISRVSKQTQYSKKDKKQIIVGVTLNCS